MSDLLLSADPDWLIIEEGIEPAREHEIESILAIANGYLGMRASVAESGRFSHPSTFIAGVYVANAGLELGPRLAVFPNCLHVEIAVEDRPLALEAGVLKHRRLLDLRQGVLWREWRQQDPSGRITRLNYLQLASLADRHVLLQSVAVTAENYAGKVSLIAGLAPSDVTRTDTALIAAQPTATRMRVSEIEVAVASASEFQGPAGSRTVSQEGGPRGGEEQWSWEASLGETARLDRIVTVFTSRDGANPAKTASDHLAATRARGFSALAQAHVDAWRCKWEAAEVRIVGDEEAQRALRFATYHLIAAVNPANEHVSIGARALTGEAYRGHVFWDTEIYMLPFYIFTDPPAARALLMYRYHTLDAARRKAKASGYEGALYAWESADTGDEATPRSVIMPDSRVVTILTGEREHHISADIGYAVWQYWRVTGDDAFMLAAGAEILVETARFWASRAQVEHDGRAHMRQVIGPDEYHEIIDDNAYTNTMAIFNLKRAADAVAILQHGHIADWERLSARFGLMQNEPQRWRALAAMLVTGFDAATKLFEQFAGYFQLQEVDLAARACAMPIDACLGPERTRRSKAIKQADVIALSALLWDEWPFAVHEANFRYYEPHTAHGSSLSPALHALVAARLGDGPLAQAYFRQAAQIDLANNMGNAAGGVHMGALGGLWQAAVFGAAGLRPREDGIAVDPHLLPGWAEMAFPVQWRGRLLHLRLEADPRRIEVTVETGDKLTLSVPGGPACLARSGRRYLLQGDRLGWGSWEEADR